MKIVRLDCGLNLKVHDEVIKEWKFFKGLSELNGGNPFALRPLLEYLLDPAEQAKLEKHFEEDGKVLTEKISDAFTELLKKLGEEAKN